VTRWLWDGNKLLHEWRELEIGDSTVKPLITSLFEEDSFAPVGKLQGEQAYGIVYGHATVLLVVEVLLHCRLRREQWRQRPLLAARATHVEQGVKYLA